MRALYQRLKQWQFGGSHTTDDTQTSDTSDEPDITVDWQWPPVKRVEAPHEGEGEQTIAVSLYWRAGDDNGLTACRQAAPYVNYCYEEAWGKKYTVDVTVVEKPVPATIETFVDFKEYIENEADTDTRSKDANCLLMDEGGLAGRGGENTAVINGPSLFEGWGYDPSEKPVLFGHGENHEGVNLVIHEVGHSLGLTHDGDVVRKYGRRMVHPMVTRYEDAGWYIHSLHRDNRKQEPDVSDSF